MIKIKTHSLARGVIITATLIKSKAIIAQELNSQRQTNMRFNHRFISALSLLENITAGAIRLLVADEYGI